MPALFTSTSSLPRLATSAAMPARSVRSNRMASIFLEVSKNSLSRPNTRIPDSDSASAAARPIPRAAPVTRTVFTPLTLNRAQAGHAETGGFELGDQRFLLLGGELDQ